MGITSDKKAFLEEIGALASEDMRESGILASLTTAQAILESGWGLSGLAVKGNALFGIKAAKSWKGRVYNAQTQECYDGISMTTVDAVFRAYGSWEESIADHSALLTGAARYKAVVGERDYRKACHAIQEAGYATDPKYAEKLIELIEAHGLTEYDGIAAPGGAVFLVGDVVQFSGTLHYSSSEAATGMPCKPGTAEITRISVGKLHPVHLIAKTGGESTVYGWVDVDAIGPRLTMRPGAVVRYSGHVYADSNGGGQGIRVDGDFRVKYYSPQKQCGVHIGELGWVPESTCTVIG